MKTLYDVLSKKEKNEVRREFKDKYPSLYSRFLRIGLTGLLLMVFSCAISAYTLITEDPHAVLYLILYGVSFIAGVFFLVKSRLLLKEALNKYIKSKKQK